MSLQFFSGTVVLSAVFLAVGCGGRTKAPVKEPAPPPPAAKPPPEVRAPERAEGWVSSPPPNTLPLEMLAPEPRIRAGLTTRAEAVRLSSSLPIRIRAGEQWMTAYDVVIEKEPSIADEGRAYAVHVASFRDLSGAQRLLGDVESETGLAGRVERESPTGRYAVRLGNWSTLAGARESIPRLTRLGYEGLRVVRRPSSVSRPQRLVLHRFGGTSAWTEELSLLCLPADLGAWIEVDGRPYRGFVELTVNSVNRFTVVNVVNLEDYLKGVVPAELSPAVFPEVEAIKAQAVAARTYAIRHLGQFAAEGFDICSTPACQVYSGYDAEQLMANDAVRATSTEVITYEGELIDALYTSTCGGHTEDVQNVFYGDSHPYLVGRPCFLEAKPIHIPSGLAAGLSLEAAGAVAVGFIASDDLQEVKDDSVTPDDLRIWSEAVPTYLGQTPCESDAASGAQVSTAGFVDVLTKSLCWEGRLPFLIPERDVERMVPIEIATGLEGNERRALAYWIQNGWLVPDADGLSPLQPISFLEASEILFRLVSARGEPLLNEALVTGVDAQDLLLSVDKKGQRLPLAPQRFLYRHVGDKTFYTPTVRLYPGDRVRYHLGPRGIDILILLSSGTSFGRSSRFHRWTVRMDQEELSQTVNRREHVGQVVDLRPKRYGKSGRVVELEIVGTDEIKLVRGLAIRRWLGLRENLFFVDKQLAPDGTVAAWVFTGGGWGHGVGLCQVGAYGMASAGYSYREILEHYYQGTEIRKYGDR